MSTGTDRGLHECCIPSADSGRRACTPFPIDYTPPVDFCRSRFIPRRAYIGIRVLFLLYFAAVTIWEPLSYTPYANNGYWFIYLTHWSALLEDVYFTVALVSAVTGPRLVHAALSEPSFDEPAAPFRVVRPARLWFRFHRVAFALAAVIPTCVFLLFWTLVAGPGVPSAPTVHMHGVNFALIVIDVVIIALPVNILHFVWPVLFGAAYVAFSAIYWKAGGVNDNGCGCIYDALNYGKSPVSAGLTAALAVVVAVPLVHLLMFLVSYAARRAASCACCGPSVEDEAELNAWPIARPADAGATAEMAVNPGGFKPPRAVAVPLNLAV